MNIGDTVLVNTSRSLIEPEWQQAVIYSIFIAYECNLYEVEFEDGSHKTYMGDYIKELNNGTNNEN